VAHTAEAEAVVAPIGAGETLAVAGVAMMVV
jgi:hypothetical protein